MAEITNFPAHGDDKAVSLRNSGYARFPRAEAETLKEDYPAIWRRGGNIRGNDAYRLWGRAIDGDGSATVLDWIREREAWAARHKRNKLLAGVVAAIKWGVVLDIGLDGMRRVINDAKDKQVEKAYSKNVDLPASVRTALPEEAQDQFRAVFNSAIGDASYDEAGAFRQAWGAVGRNWKPTSAGQQWVKKAATTWRETVEIAKRDDDKRLVFGWLLASTDAQWNELTDYQNDIVSEDELERAAYGHVLDSRKGDVMHDEKPAMILVESVALTKEKQRAMGIPAKAIPVGWWVGYKVLDDAVWQRVKSGELKAFSIGGSAYRDPVSE